MKEALSRLKELSLELEAVSQQVHEHVKAVAARVYAANELRYGHQGRSYTDMTWNPDGHSISVQWDETWNYGGHDSGTFGFSQDLLTDEEALLQYEKSAKDAFDVLKAAERAQKEKEERRQMEALQAKYPTKA